MKRLALLLILVLLAGCSSQRGTIGQLRQVEITFEKESDVGSLDKAIGSYERFLAETPESSMTAEAIRRLADLKVEKEYGLIAEEAQTANTVETPTDPESGAVPIPAAATAAGGAAVIAERPEGIDLERPGAREAVALYEKLVDDFPDYEKNDQALYQLSRAYEEQGKLEEAMDVMDRLVAEFPESRFLDEVQFRRGENFFVRRRYLDAEEAYGSVVAFGETSDFYIRALYKHGWSYYKQDLYEEALHKFIALLDLKHEKSGDLEKAEDSQDGKRIQDTLRIVSQSFSNIGGVDAAIDYFGRFGRRSYEDVIYAHLGEYYFNKQRYNDAVTTYTTFVERYPDHRQSPLFTLRIIDIHTSGGFPSLVIKAKREYAETYAYGADYWKYFNPDERPEVIAGLKSNIIDLANHSHALYRDKRQVRKKSANLNEALRWYRDFLNSFPRADETATINYQLAELLLESKSFGEAAREYEKLAYSYPFFENADKAGYAAVYAYRESLKKAADEEKEAVRQDIIRASLKFADVYEKHDKAAIVMGAAVDDLYALKEFKAARNEARRLLRRFPNTTREIRRSALLVAAHSSYELEKYSSAEKAYIEVLELLPKVDKSRAGLLDNLAASVYKQGEAENRRERYKEAAEHFLRVAAVAPKSKIRPTAEYDAAVALIKVEEWSGAITVLTDFRKNFPKHTLQQDVTKKLAFVYREEGTFALAAVEFERVGAEAAEPELRQDALLSAAELYEKVDDRKKAISVYRRYVADFPEPLELNIETRDKLATLLGRQGREKPYHDELRRIVALEAKAGDARTVRTRLIAGTSALVLARLDYDACISVRLVKPFEKNLQRKQELMRQATGAYTRLFDYEIGAVTAEATYYLAEIYADFSAALTESERPEGLSALELEEYELALEEQAYPFEEKAIEMHRDNLDLLPQGIYNDWIDKSIDKLAIFLPARYGKREVDNSEFAALTGFRFENRALLPEPPADGKTEVPE